MRIIFYGTRGSTRTRSRHHKRKTGTLIKISDGSKIYIDCGFNKKDAAAIIITDRSVRSRIDPENNQSPLWTTKSIANDIGLKTANLFVCGQDTKMCGIVILPIHVIYRFGYETIGIRIGKLFVVHHVKKIPNLRFWLSGIRYYVGDGSRFTEHKKRTSSSMTSQVRWWSRVVRCWFTNCGTEVVRNYKHYSLMLDNNKIAHDGMKFTI